LAADLVDRKVEVIVTEGGDASVLAAKQATSTIPVVFHSDGDPVARGLVASLARPGGNLTGVGLHGLAAKRVELLCDLVPQAKAIALLVNPNDPGADVDIRDAQEAARAKGVQLLSSRRAATMRSNLPSLPSANWEPMGSSSSATCCSAGEWSSS
jgi:putative ABC transport system substrate-binding protein